MTDDARQLAWERQRLADAEAKRDRATDAGTRFYYEQCVAGWQRSIGVLERRVNNAIGEQVNG